jgi:DNA repair exonuclease SbcCD ATPase subunit
MRLFIVAALVAADGEIVAEGQAATPLAKVVQLLGDLKQQVTQQGTEESKLFAEFSSWCDSETYGTKTTVGDGKSKIADLEAFIDEQKALQDKLASEIDEAIAEISSNEADLKSAKEMRQKDHGNYMSAESQYVQSLDELTRAIEVLQNPNPSFIEATQSVQKALQRAMTVTPQQQAKIKDFFQQTAQQANSKGTFLQQSQMGSHTGELIQTLQSIKDETEKNRDNAAQEEASAAQAFELLAQSLQSEISNGNKVLAGKKMQVSKSQQSVAESQSELDNTNHVVAEAEKYLNQVTLTCKQKTLEWKERSKLRSDEITAIGEAIEILQSDKGQAIQDMELRQQSQSLVPASFVQITAKVQIGERFLTGQQILAEARAAAASGQPDPFKNVRKMINDMIQRLLQEAAEEAEHKGWCDTEMGKSELQQKDKEKQVKSLSSKMEEMTAKVAQLDDEITQLTKEIAEAEAMDLEATKVRNAEKKSSLIAIKEYEDAQSLIQNAMTVLQEFYSEHQTSLVQVNAVDSADPPPTFDGSYEKKDSSGVLGILEISMSDFARLESETKNGEAQAESEYQKLIKGSAVRKATLTKDLEYKQIEKQKLEGNMQRAGADLTGFKEELDAVIQYIEKLKPSCTNTADSHEVRKERREAEIKSLQDALAILNNEGI